jgi:hypothetical protein
MLSAHVQKLDTFKNNISLVTQSLFADKNTVLEFLNNVLYGV